jgi:hypothetical protein
VIRFVVAIVVYLASGMALLVAANADQGGDWLFLLVPLAAASVGMGWIAGRRGWVLVFASAAVTWLLIPMALPFGDANKATGGDDTDPVTLLAIAPALYSMLLVLAAAVVRGLLRRAHRGSSRAAT